MSHHIRNLTAGALFIAIVAAAVVFSGAVRFDFAASDDQSDSEIDVRVQARQTDNGRVEVRAQSRLGDSEWTTHTPDARLLPIEPELGRWYSSSTIAVSVPDAPDISDEDGYTRHFVAQAIDYYNQHGREAALDFYNTPESVEGQWYIFILDENDLVVAHLNPDRLGARGDEVTAPDGYPFGRMVNAVASPHGAWVDYPLINPVSGQAEIKHSWVVRHDGLIFGSGWYEAAPSRTHAPGAFTQSFLDRALEMYRVLGREATLEYYSSPDSLDGQWYVFIIASDGTRLAHPLLPVGVNILDGDPDPTGYHYRPDIVGIEDRGWISYIFHNPERDQLERKHTWLVRRDGLIFAAGYYVEGAYEAPDS